MTELEEILDALLWAAWHTTDAARRLRPYGPRAAALADALVAHATEINDYRADMTRNARRLTDGPT